MGTIAIVAAVGRHLAALMAAGILVGGCGASASEAPAVVTYQSGSRLRAHVYDGGGGATLLQYWVDEALQIQCSFADPGDGTLRCLPNQGDISFDTDYLDSGCTQVAAAFQTGTTPPPFLLVSKQLAANLCTAPALQYFRLGQEQAAVSTLYNKSDGTCMAQPLTTPLSVFALGAPVDVSVFASAAVVTEARGSALDVQILVGDRRPTPRSAARPPRSPPRRSGPVPRRWPHISSRSVPRRRSRASTTGMATAARAHRTSPTNSSTRRCRSRPRASRRRA
jgi:hypothetical protein